MADGNKNLFAKYHKRIAREGVIKALLCGLVVGGGLLIVSAFALWLADFKYGIFVALGLALLGAGITAPVVYATKFRPTTKSIAKRVDELGLEERLLTMTELENDTSYIAKVQREDAVKALNSVDHMLVKIVVSVALIVTACIVGFFTLGMATVSSLHCAGILPGGITALGGGPRARVFTIKYTVGEGKGGIIEYTPEFDGESQKELGYSVNEGESAPQIYAVADANYVFIGWSDGVDDPYRHDIDVDENISVKALFAAVTVEDLTEPQDNFQDSNSGNNGPPQDGEPSDGEPSSGDPGDGEPSPDTSDPSASGSRDKASDQINDGNTYYGDEIGEARDEANDRLGGDNNVSEDRKGAVSDYFDSLGKGKGGD